MSLLIEQTPKDEFDLSSLQNMYRRLVKKKLNLEDVESSQVVKALNRGLANLKSELSTASRTESYGCNTLTTSVILSALTNMRMAETGINISRL